ncbi:hypothetical protein [Amycolatopsis magusensis]|uniref:hypothetical protein n=1 Tax=Amycolatopsis magusensis TaxID=882444 RepID=UPI003C30BAFB
MAGRVAAVSASAAAGAVTGLAAPFVVLMGQVLAGELGWAERDSGLIDDGLDIPIGLGIVALLFIIGTLAAVRPLVRNRLPAALAVGIGTAAVVAWLFLGG